jgi:putative transposase
VPQNRIPTSYNDCTYFITLTIVNWDYLLNNYERIRILSETIKYYQYTKSLEIFAFVFMLNHIHLIVRSPDTIGFVRDFKKYTTKCIKENIIANQPKLLDKYRQINGRIKIWQSSNMPKRIMMEKFYLQKVNYIHNNPVKKGYVVNPEDWYWLSANRDCEVKTVDWY